MLNSDLAAKCFNENRNSFADCQTAPEKFNLYNGLENMAIMIQLLLSKVESLEKDVEILRRELTPGR